MWRYILRRALLLIPIFIVISMIIFSLVHIVPGNPIDNLMGPGMTKAHEQRLIEKYYLDRPIPVQYLIWFRNMIHGDLGRSIVEKRPVSELLMHHLPYSLSLGLTAIAISFVLGVSMGIVSAARKNSLWDHMAMLVALFGVTIPSFWLGLILILIFAVWLTWFPVSGSGSLLTLILPAVTVGLGGAGLVARVTRVSMLEVASKDFIVLLHAKGLGKTAILLKHILRNALIPVITILGLRIGWVLGGAVTVEIVFGRPGLGQLLITGLYRRDYPVVQGAMLLLALGIMLGTFLADLLYAYADPRVRDQHK
ncbi:ABC transporter permease [Desulfosarcina ovata]|uniref:Peptide ABC transporter permease n=1 Tax=Desulfosarcina ovata subsp. ovata TaxID=2752305 RepID=A0A5K8AKA1_9BACT|nr:ABC transporter permease [Desulfosarcina ovata]BBO92230.1 peptide ABC transporter permease [Desulfosarcina ovata subsp. ovata]